MKIFIDSEFKCYLTQAEGFREFDVPFFDGKCDSFIEGYRYVPDGETWVRDDGVEFYGEMIAPHTEYTELDEAQREYENERLADAENALAILIGGAV